MEKDQNTTSQKDGLSIVSLIWIDGLEELDAADYQPRIQWDEVL